MPKAHVTRPHRRSAPTRPVSELLLELAYYLHATQVVARLPGRSAAPKSEPVRSSAGVRPPAPPCLTAS
jgi:hypothetical protein